MRQVVGKATRELDASDFAELRARYGQLLLDVGTGDGKHVLAEARRRPDTIVVGLDAIPDGMRRTAARAAAKPARGGVANALFVWAAVEQLPAELVDVDELHCLMPWGSLLRELVQPDVAVLETLAAACRADASFLVTLNLHAWRPSVPEVGETPEPQPGDARLTAEYARAGWQLAEIDYLPADRIADLGTSWTRRLGSSRAELAVLALRGTIQHGN